MAHSLSVVIVNYRTPELTVKCVRSLLRHNIASAEDIVVVDNASGDNSTDIIGAAVKCTQVHSTDNGGYGAGLNLGMRHARHELVLCLNPDTYFTDGDVLALGPLFEQQPMLGLVGLDLRYPSGERQFSARRDYSLLDIMLRRTPLGRWPLGRDIVDRHLMTKAWGNGIFDADWIMGTGFVVRRSAFNAIGGMDTGFFLYMEDVDLCRRLRAAGWRVAAVPGIQLIHDHQRASGQKLISPAARWHLRALRRFMRKHDVPLLPRWSG